MIPNTASLIVSAAKFAFKRPSTKLGRCSVPAIPEQPNRRALKYTFRILRCKTHLFRVVARNYELQKQPNTRFFRRQAFNYVLLILSKKHNAAERRRAQLPHVFLSRPRRSRNGYILFFKIQHGLVAVQHFHFIREKAFPLLIMRCFSHSARSADEPCLSAPHEANRMNDCPPVRKKCGAGLGAKFKIFNAFGKRSRFVTACGAGALLRRDFNTGAGFFSV